MKLTHKVIVKVKVFKKKKKKIVKQNIHILFYNRFDLQINIMTPYGLTMVYFLMIFLMYQWRKYYHDI